MKKVLLIMLSIACLNSSLHAQRRLGFVPAIHGFHFANNFHSRPGDIKGLQTDGLCGGMSLAAFNFFRYNVPIPPHLDANMDFNVVYNLKLKTSGTDALTEYLFQSQLATFGNASVILFIGPVDPDYTTEFNKAKARIDRGEYLIVGLKDKASLLGHQVLCYGYDANGLKLFVYDPNMPNVETVVTPAMEDGKNVIVLNAPGYPTDHRFKAIFEEQELYSNRTSPLTQYNQIANVAYNYNYAVQPPNVPAPASNTGFGYQGSGFNYDVEVPATDVYKFQNVQNQKYVEVEGTGFSGRTRVQQYYGYTTNGLLDGKNQQWLLIPAGNVGTEKVFYIINYGFLRYMQAGSGVTAQEGNESDRNQLWFLQPGPATNQFYIKSVSAGTYLETLSGNNNDGVSLQLNTYSGKADQLFTFTHFAGNTVVRDFSNTQFLNITPSYNNFKGLDAAGAENTNDIQLKIWDLQNGNRNQQWLAVRGNDGFYEFKPQLSQAKCADVYNASMDNSAPVKFWECHGGPNQKWIVVPVAHEQGSYIFFNKNSGKSLSVSGGNSNDNGAVITQYKFMNAANFKWKLKVAQ